MCMQAATGAIAHHLYTQLSNATTGSSSSSSGSSVEPPRTPFENLLRNAGSELSNRLYEGIAMYRQDLANIKSGAYKLPWDMTTITHRQYNPLFVLNK